MKHITDLIESYARHFHMEQQGHLNRADDYFSRLHSSLVTHSEAVSRSSVVAYREGLAGVPYNPAYQPWEAEAWESGRKDRG